MDKFDYKAWFKDGEDFKVKARFYECEYNFTLEDQYQAFRARLLAELSASRLVPNPADTSQNIDFEPEEISDDQ